MSMYPTARQSTRPSSTKAGLAGAPAHLSGHHVYNGRALVLCGDFNVAPEPGDVYDAEKVDGEILFHPAERAAFARLLAWAYTTPCACTIRKAPCTAGGITVRRRFGARPGVPHRPYSGDATRGSTLYPPSPWSGSLAPFTPAIGSPSRGGDVKRGGGVGHCSVWCEGVCGGLSYR